MLRVHPFAGVDSYFADYRGYGQSEVVPTIDALKADALAVYDSLVASGRVRPEALIVHSHSMGTFIATYPATQRPVAGLVLESPVTSERGIRWPPEQATTVMAIIEAAMRSAAGGRRVVRS